MTILGMHATLGRAVTVIFVPKVSKDFTKNLEIIMDKEIIGIQSKEASARALPHRPPAKPIRDFFSSPVLLTSRNVRLDTLSLFDLGGTVRIRRLA